jgi:predicted RNA-binding Zn-ribbon protein involved in translation (DUF1610 family)
MDETDRINKRHCPKCGEWYAIAEERESSPISCPRCGWKPGGNRDSTPPDL